MKLALFLTALMAASPIYSQTGCAPREKVVDHLSSKYGETRQSMGLAHTHQNSVIEVFASSETGTWTITLTSPHGITCLVASGTAFDATPVPEGANL